MVDDLKEFKKLFVEYKSDEIYEKTEVPCTKVVYFKTINPDDIEDIIGENRNLFIVLDTNILLDVLFNRDKEIVKMYESLFNKNKLINKKDKIIVSTTIINIAEIFKTIKKYGDAFSLLKKIEDIDDVLKAFRGNIPNRYKDSKFVKYSDSFIKKYLKKLYYKILTKLYVLLPEHKGWDAHIMFLRDIIFRDEIEDKDALISWIIMWYGDICDIYNIEGPYFLTRDDKLSKSKILRENIQYVYYLDKDGKGLKEFKNYVLKNYISIE